MISSELSSFSDQLRFSPADGRIWLDQRRMLLLDADGVVDLRRELNRRMGFEAAKALMMQLGYSKGAKDAFLSEKIKEGEKYFEVLRGGLQLYGMTGFASVEVHKAAVVIDKGKFFAECTLHDSVEVSNADGLSHAPLCWTAIGYASGYCTTLLGKSIVFKEITCRGMGHQSCRIIGKTAEQWGKEAESFFEDLRETPIINQRLYRPKPSYADGLDLEVVGISAGFNAAAHLVKKAAPTDATVLFLGETGVGKEVFAKMLHQLSLRADKPFVAVNCAALPEGLIEAELFGVERGAYTGAIASRAGRFERANGGTIFLDEIGTLAIAAQAKLLRILQEGEFERVGNTKTIKTDVRVIAATNAHLQEAVEKGTFREDLYFRLAAFPIRIPPLRERRDDIPLLVDFFLKRYTYRYKKTVRGISDRGLRALLSYDYPGNVRMLQHMLERAVILVDENEAIDVQHLFSEEQRITPKMASLDHHGRLRSTQPGWLSQWVEHVFKEQWSIEHIEESLVAEAMQRASGNMAKAARMLGMTRSQVVYRLQKMKEKGKVPLDTP
jgi:DNA-binding NtrC family response regulator/predicted hydrocarbon binding protein